MENLLNKIRTGQKQRAYDELSSMSEASISHWVGLYEGVHGEEILPFLCDYFYACEQEHVIKAIGELCLIHLAYLDVEKEFYYPVIQYAAQCYPTKKKYTELLNSYIPKRPSIKKTGKWQRVETETIAILDGSMERAEDHKVILDKYVLTLQDFLSNDVEHLTSQIDRQTWKTIISELGLEKRGDQHSYKTASEEYIYYWKDDEAIILISFTEKQPSRYLSNVVALFKYV